MTIVSKYKVWWVEEEPVLWGRRTDHGWEIWSDRLRV